MVFYRKYRPQTIDELDSQEVRESLYSVLSQPLEDIPHAYLFTGPKGLGKTSTARIVAKVVNCTGRAQSANRLAQSEEIEPCNTCSQCTSIMEGTNMDVIEMDAASNRGIDEVRELKETITLAPLSAKKKIYIIDEVHMLTTEAFNALLKTLEEPPSHALFILCTTELHKVPSTILSRCFHVTFRLATEEELVRSFKRIVKNEKLSIDDDALLLIAKMADGGFRDGAKMLEEVAAKARTEKITASSITDHFHLTGSERIITELISSFVAFDSKKGILALIEANKQGIDTKYLIEKLLSLIHETILATAGVSTEKEKALSTLSLDQLIMLADLLSKSYQEIKYAVLPQLPLEIAVLEWASQKGEVIEPHTSNAESTATVVISETISIPTLRRQVGNLAKQRALTGEKNDLPTGGQGKVTPATSGVSILHYSNDGDITREWLTEFWKSLLDRLKSDHHTIAGVLRGCVLKSFDRKILIIQTPFQFHKERLDDEKNKRVIETVCKELTGNPITVTIELANTRKGQRA